MTKWDDLLVNNGARIHQGHGRRLASVPTGDREIDKEGGVRTRPMKVILASISRTGTVCKLPYCPSSRAMKLSRRYTMASEQEPLLKVACSAASSGVFCRLQKYRGYNLQDVRITNCYFEREIIENISLMRQAMYTAFQKLDLHPYHMVEAIKMPARDLAIAVEAIDARNTERAYGIAEFDKWIGDYDSVCDTPMNLLVKELIEAYPEAKVILTTRDPAKWRKSIENSILIIDKWRVWGYLPLISPDCAAFIKMMHKMDEVMDGYSIAALKRHNAGIREVVPKGKLLEFTLGEDGWKELCEFIELPQPEGEFPNVNDGKLFATMHVVLINIWVMKALKDAAVRVAPWAILLGSMWFVKRLGYF
ncbi:hypothetical protein D6C98_03040 [Aureobasidium pullulans]|nr:hypothetical protein D6C98_03040 [Aureobasidium pullulans]THZ19157.1 hypothetical protein D6C89_07906 [Aureobasidium pullulans]